VADVVDLEEVDHALLDLGAQLHLLAPRAAEIEQDVEDVRAQVAVPAELDVVEHGHAAKERDVLEAARQPERRPLRRRQDRKARNRTALWWPRSLGERGIARKYRAGLPDREGGSSLYVLHSFASCFPCFMSSSIDLPAMISQTRPDC
jgi:hypothetical protein